MSEITDLRSKIRGSQAQYKVLKNTLAKIVVKDTPLEGMTSLFKGPTALAFSEDPVSAAKATVKFSESNDKLIIVGGYMEGKVLSSEEVKALAKLPSLEELRSKILSVLVAPATRLAVLSKESGAKLLVFCRLKRQYKF